MLTPAPIGMLGPQLGKCTRRGAPYQPGGRSHASVLHAPPSRCCIILSRCTRWLVSEEQHHHGILQGQHLDARSQQR